MKKILIIEDSKAFSDILSSLINKQLDIDCDVATDYHSAAKLSDLLPIATSQP